MKVSKKDAQGRLREPRSAKEWASTLFRFAVEGGSINTIESYRAAGSIVAAKAADGWNLVASFGQGGVILVEPQDS